jgi:hypothetical protein
MQLVASAQLDGYIAKVRLHPRLPRLAALARGADSDQLVVWQMEADSGLTELERRRIDAAPSAADRLDPLWLCPRWPRVGRAMDIAFHPREDCLAVVRHGVPVELRFLSQGTTLPPLSAVPADDALAFSPSGRWAIFSCRPPVIHGGEDYCRTPRLVDLQGGVEASLAWETDTTYAFHPAERLVAGGWNDQGGGSVMFLELPPADRLKVQTFDVPGWVSGLVFSPDGAALAVIGGAGFDGHFCLEVYEFRAEPYPSCRRRFAREWDVPRPPRRGRRSGRRDKQWHALLNEGHDFELPWPERVVFSEGSAALVYPGLQGELIELDAATGAERGRWQAHEKMATSLDAAHGRGMLASGGRDGRVALWKFTSA